VRYPRRNFEEEDIDITTYERRCSVESLGDNTAVLRAVQEKAALWYSTSLSPSLSLSLSKRQWVRGASTHIHRDVCTRHRRMARCGARNICLQLCQESARPSALLRAFSALSLSLFLSRAPLFRSCQPSLSHSLSFTTLPAVTISFSYPHLSPSLNFFESPLLAPALSRT